jgi:hypothetical protein
MAEKTALIELLKHSRCRFPGHSKLFDDVLDYIQNAQNANSDLAVQKFESFVKESKFEEMKVFLERRRLVTTVSGQLFGRRSAPSASSSNNSIVSRSSVNVTVNANQSVSNTSNNSMVSRSSVNVTANANQSVSNTPRGPMRFLGPVMSGGTPLLNLHDRSVAPDKLPSPWSSGVQDLKRYCGDFFHWLVSGGGWVYERVMTNISSCANNFCKGFNQRAKLARDALNTGNGKDMYSLFLLPMFGLLVVCLLIGFAMACYYCMTLLTACVSGLSSFSAWIYGHMDGFWVALTKYAQVPTLMSIPYFDYSSYYEGFGVIDYVNQTSDMGGCSALKTRVDSIENSLHYLMSRTESTETQHFMPSKEAHVKYVLPTEKKQRLASAPGSVTLQSLMSIIHFEKTNSQNFSRVNEEIKDLKKSHENLSSHLVATKEKFTEDITNLNAWNADLGFKIMTMNTTLSAKLKFLTNSCTVLGNNFGDMQREITQQREIIDSLSTPSNSVEVPVDSSSAPPPSCTCEKGLSVRVGNLEAQLAQLQTALSAERQERLDFVNGAVCVGCVVSAVLILGAFSSPVAASGSFAQLLSSVSAAVSSFFSGGWTSHVTLLSLLTSTELDHRNT